MYLGCCENQGMGRLAPLHLYDNENAGTPFRSASGVRVAPGTSLTVRRGTWARRPVSQQVRASVVQRAAASAPSVNYRFFLNEENPYQVGLGGFGKKFKKAVKKAAKPVAKVAKKVVVAHKIGIASTASAIGFKRPVQKALKLTDKQMKLANKIGVAQKVVAGAAVAVVAAPYAGAALSATGKAALTAGKFVAGKGMVLGKALGKSKLVGAAANLFKKKQAAGDTPEASTADDGSGYGPLDFSGVTDAVKNEAGPDYAGSPENMPPAAGGPGVPSSWEGEEKAPEAASEGEKKANPLAVLAPIGALLLLA